MMRSLIDEHRPIQTLKTWKTSIESTEQSEQKTEESQRFSTSKRRTCRESRARLSLDQRVHLPDNPLIIELVLIELTFLF